jgi:glycosyltransferase involved in cell wall biosynthesis
MRIAYLVTRAEPIGGVQVHLRDLATALRAAGHSPTVMTGGGGALVDWLRAQDIPTVVLQHLRGPIAPLRDLRAVREIRAVLTELRPDLLALHSAKAGVLGRIVARSLRMPVILTAHGWNFAPGFPALPAAVYRRIERATGPLASKIITVSEFDRQLALHARVTDAHRLVTVYNGIPDVPHSLRADPARSPVRLVMVARFAPQKDHATLLRALGGLHGEAWELDLVGDGPLLGEMKALAGSLGIESRVRFLGQRTDVDQILADAQVSLLVTNWEGFPISILEAMRAGLPVVASSVGGIDEAVHDGETGFLVPRGGVDPLRERLRWLLADPAARRRLGANGRARYEQQFTLTQTVTKTLAVYREVLAGATASELTTTDYVDAESG